METRISNFYFKECKASRQMELLDSLLNQGQVFNLLRKENMIFFMQEPVCAVVEK
jgi:hypothetical protein